MTQTRLRAGGWRKVHLWSSCSYQIHSRLHHSSRGFSSWLRKPHNLGCRGHRERDEVEDEPRASCVLPTQKHPRGCVICSRARKRGWQAWGLLSQCIYLPLSLKDAAFNRACVDRWETAVGNQEAHRSCPLASRSCLELNLNDRVQLPWAREVLPEQFAQVPGVWRKDE